MLFRRRDAVAGLVERSRYLWVDVIWISARVGKKSYAFPDHVLYQPFGLRGIELPHVAAVASESIRVRVGIEHVEAACNDEVIACSFLHFTDDRQKQPCPVLIASAVAALTGVAGQKFAHEITVACLDVDTVESGLLCQKCAYDISLDQTVKVFIRDDYLVSLVQIRIMLGDKRTGQMPLRSAVAPGMRELKYLDRPEAMLLHAQFIDLADQITESAHIRGSQHHLELVCPSFRNNGICLEPDEPVSAVRIFEVSVIYEL